MSDHPDRNTLLRYASATLVGAAREQMEAHLADCPGCRETLTALASPSVDRSLDATDLETRPPSAGPELPAVSGYVLTGTLGQGGMGAVYLGRDERLGRDVAIKVMRTDLCARPDLVRRFLEEAQVASQLQHPGIPPVHALDFLPDGRPFFAMKVVRGRTLAELLRDRPGPPDDLARWLPIYEQVCQAVAYAHSKGVLHRDLKPANVMVGAFGEVQVMDWGLAKVMTREEAPAERVTSVRSLDDERTQAGSVLGTWAYMPPEQARGEVDRLGPASDVFGLGAILCELLTTRPPYVGLPVEVRAQAQAADLEAAWARLEACGADAELVRLARACLSAGPADRPAGAAALAQVVADYQEGVQRRLRQAELQQAEDAIRTEEARARSALEGRARRRIAAGGVLLLVVVSAAAAVLFAQNRQLEQTNIDLEKAYTDVRIAEGRAKDKEAEERAARIETQREYRRAETARRRAEQLVYVGQIERALTAWHAGGPAAAAELRDRCQWDLRGWEHRYLHTLIDHSHIVLRGHTHLLRSVCFRPDGAEIASGGADLGVRLWDVRTGQGRLTLKGHTGMIISLGYRPDGAWLASGAIDGTVRLWDVTTGQQLHLFGPYKTQIAAVCFSPDGSLLAAAGYDGIIRVWDARTHRELRALQGDADVVFAIGFSPDGTRLAATQWSGIIRVWEWETGREALQVRGGGHLYGLAVSPDGTRLATGCWDNALRIWDAQTGQERLTLRGHAGEASILAFSPDGSRLASGGQDRTVRVWDAWTGRELFTFRGHRGSLSEVAFSPDGQELASVDSLDPFVRLWDGRMGASAGPRARRKLGPAQFSCDGTRLVCGAEDGTIVIHDAASGSDAVLLRGHRERVSCVCFRPDGEHLASASHDRTIKIWNSRGGQERHTLRGHESFLWEVCYSPDGTRLASSSYDRTVRLWDAESGKLIRVLEGAMPQILALAFHPDGRRLAVGDSGLIDLWDTETGQKLRTFRGHLDHVSDLGFSPDGTRLASASSDRTIRVWDVETAEERLLLTGHAGFVTRVCYSPDGQRLASCATDGSVRLWDAQTGLEMLAIREPGVTFVGIGFRPDGSALAGLGSDGLWRLWEARAEQHVRRLRGHSATVTGVAFRPDGAFLVSGSQDRTVRMWDARSGQEAHTLKGHTSVVTAVGFSGDGQRVVATGQDGTVRSWDRVTGQEVVPCDDPPPPRQSVALHPDGRTRARTDVQDIIVEPLMLREDDTLTRRRADPLRAQAYHLEMARQAQQANDSFALAFHLRPLLRGFFTQQTARPQETFPLWAQRPPLARPGPKAALTGLTVSPTALARLERELTADAERSNAWEAWAGRGWCRYLRGDAPGALADLDRALALRPQELSLLALRATLSLRHGRKAEADVGRARLAAVTGESLVAWHVAEAGACEEEGAWEEAVWHLGHLIGMGPGEARSARLRRARALLASGREVEAAADYARLVAADSTDREALTGEALLAAARGDGAGHRRACEALARSVLSMKDPDWEKLRPLLWLPGGLAEPMQIDKAMRRPGLRSVLAGGLLLRSGRAKEAQRPLQDAVSRGFDRAPAELLLVVAYMQTGQREAAEGALLRARLRSVEPAFRRALLQCGAGALGLWPALGAAATPGPLHARPEESLELRILLREAEAAVRGP